VRAVHLELAKKFDWDIINANQPIPTVHENIWMLVRKKFTLNPK